MQKALMEQSRLSLVCLREDFAAKCEGKMAEFGIMKDTNSDIILLDYDLLKKEDKLKKGRGLKYIENKKAIIIFENKLDIEILSEILFKKNVFGIFRLDQFEKITQIIKNIEAFGGKDGVVDNGSKKFLLKNFEKDLENILSKDREDILLKFVLENEFNKDVEITEGNKKLDKKFSYHLDCKVEEVKLLIVGLFLALYAKDRTVVLKSEALRLKYGVYLESNLKTSGGGDIDIFIKSNDLVINSSKKIGAATIEKLQKMIKS